MSYNQGGSGGGGSGGGFGNYGSNQGRTPVVELFGFKAIAL